MKDKIKIPKGWTFKCFKVDGEQTEFVYEDEFGEEHSYFDYKEHIPTYKELEERIDKALEYIEKESWFMYKDDKLVIDRTPVEELLNILKGSDNNDK